MSRITDAVIAQFMLVVAGILMVASMALGPFGYEELSIASSAASCVLAVAGICFAFYSWQEEENKSSSKKEEK